MSAKKKVAIIGGGVTGLATAFYLQKESKKRQLPIDFTLYEKSDRLGGKIQTDTTNGFVIEKGPDSFLARKESAAKLAADVGLFNELIRNRTGQAYVLNSHKLHPLPAGSVMGIPTALAPFLATKLFTPVGKARAALDLLLPRTTKEKQDQSLGTFFRQRLGDEVTENVIEPLLSGIYAGDIDDLSLMATFPQFYEVEHRYRSLILGMKKTTPQPRAKKQGGAFLTLKTGLQTLVAAIEAHLPVQAIHKNKSVQKVIKRGKGYELVMAEGEKAIFDAVVIATPHTTAKKLLQDYSFMSTLNDTPSTTVATVALSYDADKVKLGHDGTGFVVSRNANYAITACTWTHRKWPHTTPEGKVLLRAYVGRPGNSDIVEEDDDTIVQIALRDLNRVMQVEGNPNFHIVTRWQEAMPQYTVGHKYRIEAVKSNLANQLPGVFLAGASYEGVGIPDCINQGIEAVASVIECLDGS